jgi:hypothetical protein
MPQQPDEDDVWYPSPVVFLQDEGVYAHVVSYGAYASRVRYVQRGISYEIVVENEDIMDVDGD